MQILLQKSLQYGLAGLALALRAVRQERGHDQDRHHRSIFRAVRRHCRQMDNDQALHQAARRHCRRQKDRAYPQGRRRRRAGRRQTAGAGTRRARSRRHPGRLVLTPNALAAGAVSAEAKKFMVVMNAATSIITTKSPYMARTSSTTPQFNQTLGDLGGEAGDQGIYTMVSDYGPGIDAETASIPASRRPAARSSARFASRSPIRTSPPSSSAPRTSIPTRSTSGFPAARSPRRVGKALAERGIDTRKIKLLGQDVLADDTVLKSLGDPAIGITTVVDYNYSHNSALNHAFVAAYQRDYHRNPDIFSIGGYDGTHLIYEALKKTGGNTDADSPDRRRQGDDSGKARAARSSSTRKRATSFRPSISAGSIKSAACCKMSSSIRSKTSRTPRSA